MNRLPIPITADVFDQKLNGTEDIEREHELENDDNQSSLSSARTSIDNPTEALHISEKERKKETMSFDRHAKIVVAILKPVLITMFLVIFSVYLLEISTQPSISLSWMVYQEQSNDSTVVKLGGSIIDAFVFVLLIIAVTFLLVLLYKYRCLKIIYGWLILSTGVLLAFFGGGFVMLILYHLNFVMDWITFLFFLWNFTVVGILSIFWYTPARITQGYLIVISALMALFFTRLPEWTTWTLLVAIAIYDLFAVLCPRGPLRILVELAEERQEPIPALLYNESFLPPTGSVTGSFEPSVSEKSSSSDSGSDQENNPSTDDADDQHSESLPLPPSLPSSSSTPSVFQTEAGNEGFFSTSFHPLQHSSSSSIAPMVPKVIFNEDSDEEDEDHSAHSLSINSLSLDDDDNNNEDDDDDRDKEGHSQRERRSQDKEAAEKDDDIIILKGQKKEDRSVKLGLGDFVFYSVLVGRAAMYSIVTVFTCTFAIITGLFATLVLLAVFRKALPALPISIALGTLCFIASKIFLVPYVIEIGLAGIIV